MAHAVLEAERASPTKLNSPGRSPTDRSPIYHSPGSDNVRAGRRKSDVMPFNECAPLTRP